MSYAIDETKQSLSIEESISEIGPLKYLGYNPGEEAKLHVEFNIEATRSWYDTVDFNLLYDIFYKDGTPIEINGFAGYFTFDWLWVLIKEWDRILNISLGPMPEESIEGYFILKDYELNVLGSADFYIPLKGEIPPPPPPEEEKIPWGWLVAGGGLLALGLIIRTRR